MNIPAIEAIYREHCAGATAIAYHLPILQAYASDCYNVVEFGVKNGASSAALMLGCTNLTSYDIAETKKARELEALAGGAWDYRIQDSRTATPTVCDMLFIDSLHTYDQMRAELDRHGSFVRKILAFHDVTTFGEVGADGETGRQAWTYTPGQSCPMNHLGIRPAIDEFMIGNPTWRIDYRAAASHGLLVLRR